MTSDIYLTELQVPVDDDDSRAGVVLEDEAVLRADGKRLSALSLPLPRGFIAAHR